MRFLGPTLLTVAARAGLGAPAAAQPPVTLLAGDGAPGHGGDGGLATPGQPAPPQPKPAPKPLAARLDKSAYAVAKGGRRRLRATGRVRKGTNHIALRVKLAPGRYRLVLTATSGGASARDVAKLTIRRPR